MIGATLTHYRVTAKLGQGEGRPRITRITRITRIKIVLSNPFYPGPSVVNNLPENVRFGRIAAPKEEISFQG